MLKVGGWGDEGVAGGGGGGADDITALMSHDTGEEEERGKTEGEEFCQSLF